MEPTVMCYIIDDDKDDHELFMYAMEKSKLPIQCQFESDPEKAIQILTKDDSFIPQFIFIDIRMPVIDGLECIEIVKNIKRLQNTPIYVYSGFCNPEFMMGVKKLGVSGFVEKKVNIDTLWDQLRQIFEGNN